MDWFENPVAYKTSWYKCSQLPMGSCPRRAVDSNAIDLEKIREKIMCVEFFEISQLRLLS